MPRILVSYEVSLTDDQVKKLQSPANELGYGYNDAGPQETIRRWFEREGVDALEEALGHEMLPMKRV